MRKFLVIFTVAILLAGISWWLNGYLKNASFSVWHPENFTVVRVESWNILPKLWPVVLAGILIGGFLTLAVVSALLPFAKDNDHAENIRRLTISRDDAVKAAKKYQQQAISAYVDTRTNVENELHDKISSLEKREAQIASKEAYARDIELNAKKLIRHIQAETEKHIQAATSERDTAISNTADAEKRRQNATAANERRKRKIAKLEIL